MKTLHKTLIAGLVCAIPLGILAHDKYEEKYDLNKEELKKAFFMDDDRDHDKDDKYLRELYEKKGVNYIFEGKLQKRPVDSLNGTWLIAGVNVIVDDKTIIYQNEKTIKNGDEIYVAAKRVDNKIYAIELEQDD